MITTPKDEAAILTLVERFEKQRLPRALDIKKRVDAGERLSDTDLSFLNEVFADSRHVRTLAARAPEWQELYTRAISLYKEIMDKALENERQGD
jgi:hypothetical protein